ncbi:MAG: exonuclease domain-containing protein [Candidatus Doudnabacteria bacterium]
MKFIKDILVIHLETTGPKEERDSILQLSAVLLDKDNLLEKNFFNKHIKVSFLEAKVKEHADKLDIPFEQLKQSPKVAEVIKEFVQEFDYTPLLAFHSLKHYLFLKQAFKKTLTNFTYDDHVIDIWSLGYIYTISYGLGKIPTLTTLAEYFNIPIDEPNNALIKARASAQILRKIILG